MNAKPVYFDLMHRNPENNLKNRKIEVFRTTTKTLD